MGACFDWILLYYLNWLTDMPALIVSRCKKVYYTCFFVCHKGLFFSSARGHSMSFTWCAGSIYGPQASINDVELWSLALFVGYGSQWVLIHILLGSNWDWLDWPAKPTCPRTGRNPASCSADSDSMPSFDDWLHSMLSTNTSSNWTFQFPTFEQGTLLDAI
jgi:hypothetical protein